MDILSGSYSRHSRPMAGLFQVLRGKEGGGFAKAVPLEGTDGKPLEITTDDEDADTSVDKICTRAFAVDLDGDGDLDLVSGNFAGTFALFAGEGEGRFAPDSAWLEDQSGEPLRVQMHSDPFFVDWDGDGDLDLLSGSGAGGVFLFVNVGDKKAAKFAAAKTLLEPAGHDREQHLGDAHVQAPHSSTRVWADDVDGDGKLDLLVGDAVALCYVADGVAEAEAKTRLADWNERQSELFQTLPRDGSRLGKAEQAKFDKEYQALQEERATFVRDDRTGFVWVLRQK